MLRWVKKVKGKTSLYCLYKYRLYAPKKHIGNIVNYDGNPGYWAARIYNHYDGSKSHDRYVKFDNLEHAKFHILEELIT